DAPNACAATPSAATKVAISACGPVCGGQGRGFVPHQSSMMSDTAWSRSAVMFSLRRPSGRPGATCLVPTSATIVATAIRQGLGTGAETDQGLGTGSAPRRASGWGSGWGVGLGSEGGGAGAAAPRNGL